MSWQRALPFIATVFSAPLSCAAQDSQAASPMLSEAVRFEVRRGSAPPVSFGVAESALHPLDLEDIVYIRLNRQLLSRFVVAGQSLSASTLDRAHQQVLKLQEMLSALEKLAPIAVEIAEARKQILAGKTQGPEYAKIIRRYEIAWRDTKRSVRAYLEANSSDTVKAEERLNELAKDPTNKLMAEFLTSEINRLSSHTQGAIQDASRDAPLGLRLQAAAMRRKKGGTPIHLDGYDDGQPGQIQFRDKLSFAQSADRQRAIDESLEAATAVKGTIDNIRSSRRSLVSILRETYGPMIVEASGLPPPQSILARLTEMHRHAERLRGLAASSVDLQKAYANLVANASGAAKDSLSPDLSKLIEKVRGLSKPKTDVELLAAIRAIAESEILTPSRLKNVVSDLKVTTTTLSGIATEAVQDTVPEQVTAEIKSTLTDMSLAAAGLADDFSKVEQFVSRLTSASDMLKLADTGNLLTGIEAAEWTAYSVPLSQVRDTWIDMNTVEADDGDKLVVTARVLHMGGNSEDGEVISSFSGQVPVASLGWSASISGDLLFAQRQNADSFVTATGISYVYKYRPWDKATRLNRFLTVLNPGIGLTFAALNFSDDSIQTGIGVTGTFLNGLASVGYGYNMQAGKNPGFLFLGLRFAGVAQQVKSATR